MLTNLTPYTMTKTVQQLLSDLAGIHGSEPLSTKYIQDYAAEHGYSFNFQKLQPFKVGRGRYILDGSATPQETPTPTPTPTPSANTVTMLDAGELGYTPNKDPLYVAHGFFKDLVKIFKADLFYPTFITGLSGNGKTFMVEQASAKTGKEMIRANITAESDENSLIGGFRLVNGSTVWQDGPVLTAMKRGSILLLDEIDLGTAKIMCLQSILEGKPYFNKQTGEVVNPAHGFNIVATANTKGKGSEDGRFIGTNVLNEAFLERFPITVEQPYPTKATERKIVAKHFDALGIEDQDDFITHLVDWADIIRKTFYDGGIDELISTRRLGHIAKAFAIFNNKMEAIKYCINRFDEETKDALLNLYTKIDEGADPEELEMATESSTF